MLIASIIIFALAALLGLYLLSYILKNKNTPKGLAFIHGPLAVLGLVVLIIYSFLSHSPPIISIILFILAALGGMLLIFRDITGKSVPRWLALGHGLIAILGFIFLIIFFINKY